MNAVFFISLTIFLIILQTIVLPSFSWFGQWFDLLIIDVLFLSLISSHSSTIAAVILIGCIMDSISGAPFCYYIFSYLWIYIIVFLIKQFVFQKSIIFVFIISVVSVIIQQGLLLFSAFIAQGYNAIWTFNFDLLMSQIFWGFIFIPPSIWLVNIFWQNWILAMNFLQARWFKNIEGRID